jgi:hypothetical protein
MYYVLYTVCIHQNGHFDAYLAICDALFLCLCYAFKTNVNALLIASHRFKPFGPVQFKMSKKTPPKPVKLGFYSQDKNGEYAVYSK